jgi:ATP-binding cassette subfamily B protein
MPSHRRQKVRPTAPPAEEAPVESTTTLLPILTAGEPVDAAPSVPIRLIFRRFWPDTRGFRVRLAFGLALVGAPPLLSAVGIWLFKVLVDDVLAARDLARFPLVAAAFVAVTVVEGAVGFVDEYLTAWVGERFVLNLRSRLFDHLQRLSLTFFERHQLGDLLARLSGDIGAIEQLVLSGINQALTYLFQIVFFAGALFVLDWRLAGAALVAAPGFLLIARFFSRRIKAASAEQRRRSGSITSVAEESLHNTALVQAYHRQDHESARFRRENLASFTAQMVAIKLEALFAPFTDLLRAAGVLAVIGFGIRELIAGRITLGGLLVFLGYLSQLYGPISGLGGLTNSIYAASAGAERVIEVLDTRPEVTDPDAPVSLGRARGELRVDRVTYRYPDSNRPALVDIGFSARPGETVAVVGASGAGKSTLLRILLRLHDPHAGAVTLDGVDLRDLRLGELRTNVAVVLQETLVFDGTVLENIRWGRPDASLEQVVAAARAADAHQFVTALPHGYQTRIGQRGMMLSGGQRQRIALARAIIRDAPVLLLDEPTTGLDAAATQRVMAPLRRAMSGRTTVVISHNLLTVADADRIVYLERGRVAGYGSHAELLATAPGYAELYRLHHPDPRGGATSSRPTASRTMAPARPAAPHPAAPRPAAPHPAAPRPAAPPRPAPGPRTSARPTTGSSPAPALPPTGGRPGPASRPHPTPAPLPAPAVRPRLAPRPARTAAHQTPHPRPAPHPTPAVAPAVRPTPIPRPTPVLRPTPRPAAAAPVPTPEPTPRPMSMDTASPMPKPIGKPRPTPRTTGQGVPKPIGHPVPAPRPMPVERHTPMPLPIPLPRQAPSGAQPAPRWSTHQPFGADPPR